MKALVFEAPEKAVVADLDRPEIGPDEVLVRTVATGLCHTDLTVLAGRQPTELPAVLGHESAGVVEAVGTGVTRVGPGDHVLLTFNSCGHCARCRSGGPRGGQRAWLPCTLSSTRARTTPAAPWTAGWSDTRW